MGINCLFPFLRRFGRNVNLREFSGQTAAIDASCWIHKALSVSVSRSGSRERFENIFKEYLRAVVNARITPIVVFDGLPLPAKANEDEIRRRDRENRLRKAEESERSPQEANRLRSQAASITFDDVTVCIQICLQEKVAYVVAPYEADAQIAFLLSSGYAEFAITEDSDLLAYGCKKVVVKASINGEGECFSLAEILEGLRLSRRQFLQMCIAAGCDFLKNVRGIGINRAYDFVKKGNLMESLVERGASQEYQEYFYMAEAVFQHQTVFDLNACSTIPLEKWDTDPPGNVQHLCGKILEDSYSSDLAAGNIDPKSGKKVNSFPLLAEAVKTSPNGDGASTGQATFSASPNGDGTSTHQATLSDSDGGKHQGIRIDLIHVDRFSSFRWKVPCFPVLTIEFVKVCFKMGTEIRDGVIQKNSSAGIQRGAFLCTSHCEINVNGRKYTVLWELTTVKKAPTPQPSVHASTTSTRPDNQEEDQEEDDQDDQEEDDASDSDEAVEPTEHSLPFKVLGTCHARSRQEALKEAFELVYGQNKHISVKLEAEPSNFFDSRAIAVLIKSSIDYKKVGYIAKELTQFVHPLLEEQSLEVSVRRIRFCTTFLMIGFYLSIDITKRGLWEKPVIKASQKVK